MAIDPKWKKVKKEKIEHADSLDSTCINLIDSANGKRPKMKKVKKEKIENAFVRHKTNWIWNYC